MARCTGGAEVRTGKREVRVCERCVRPGSRVVARAAGSGEASCRVVDVRRVVVIREVTVNATGRQAGVDVAYVAVTTVKAGMRTRQ